MDSINLMVEEHKYIKRMLVIIRKLCINILNGKEVDYDAFDKAIDFIRNYADKHHHNKEEDILFEKMQADEKTKAGVPAVLGMFTDHNMGRNFIGNLEKALERVRKGDRDSEVDIIANAVAYTDLLNRHIDTEDSTLYKFAEKHLSDEAKADVEQKCKQVESAAENRKLQEKYIKLVNELESIVS